MARVTPRFFTYPGRVNVHSDWQVELVDEVADFMERNLVSEAEQLARVNAPVDSGELAGSISARVRKYGKTVVALELTASAPHADFVEYGTGRRGSKTKDVRGTGSIPPPKKYTHGPKPGMVAQPYLRPALLAIARNHFGLAR